ncbi:MAG: hypothetical protein IPN08_11330 [Bacteroidales bacterium]|nr:hypothetical protein [Bacteroidales bacterium]
MGKTSATIVKHLRQLLIIATLFVIPAILLFTSINTIRARDKAWYGGGYDPEYAYLFNSLNMARFRLAGHIDHPGTTMQVTGGLVLQGAWMADRRGESLTRAVLSEPEHYIRILNVATAIIGSLALLILAIFVFSKTGNIGYALLLQLTPFISGFILFNGYTRITQELMQMLAAFAVAAASIIWYFRKSTSGSGKFVLLFGIICGFGMASKILFAPLLIIPLVLFHPIKEKIWFLLTSGASFVVFTLPVIRLYPNMFYWIYRLFFHTGQYGTGTKGVIDTSRYSGDLVNLFMVSPVLAIIFGLSILVLLILLGFRMVKKYWPDASAARLLLAVSLAQAAGYLLVAKQPKEVYLLPYESIAAINFILILHLTVSFVSSKVVGNVITGLVTVSCIILVIPYGIARKEAIYTTERNPVWENAWLSATGTSEKHAVICANPGSSPAAGLYFGNAYSIKRYVPDLQKIYPDFYILDGFTGMISHWGNNHVSIDSLFDAYKGKIIYIGPPVHDQRILDLLDLKTRGYRFRAVYSDGYQVLMEPVEIDGEGNVADRKLIFNGAEASPLNPELPLKSDGLSFPGVLSYNKSFSGRSSIVTNARNPYAFSIDPEVLRDGDQIDVIVKASGKPDDIRIVLSGEDSPLLYTTASPDTELKESEWYQVRLKAVIPSFMAGKKIKLYAWNKGKDLVYFDNFRMEIYRPIKTLNTTNEPVNRK